MTPNKDANYLRLGLYEYVSCLLLFTVWLCMLSVSACLSLPVSVKFVCDLPWGYFCMSATEPRLAMMRKP